MSSSVKMRPLVRRRSCHRGDVTALDLHARVNTVPTLAVLTAQLVMTRDWSTVKVKLWVALGRPRLEAMTVKV